MRNAEIPEEGGRFRIPGVGDVKTSYYRSPEVTKPEVAKCEIMKCQRLHTGGSDTGSWRCQGLSRQESRSCEVRKDEKLS
jgi:hypothetical protein